MIYFELYSPMLIITSVLEILRMIYVSIYTNLRNFINSSINLVNNI